MSIAELSAAFGGPSEGRADDRVPPQDLHAEQSVLGEEPGELGVVERRGKGHPETATDPAGGLHLTEIPGPMDAIEGRIRVGRRAVSLDVTAQAVVGKSALAFGAKEPPETPAIDQTRRPEFDPGKPAAEGAHPGLRGQRPAERDRVDDVLRVGSGHEVGRVSGSLPAGAC